MCRRLCSNTLCGAFNVRGAECKLRRQIEALDNDSMMEFIGFLRTLAARHSVERDNLKNQGLLFVRHQINPISR